MADRDSIKVHVTQYADRRYWVMYYRDPVTEAMVTRSTKKDTRRDAEREAARWEVELSEGQYQSKQNLTWEEFRIKYETEEFPNLGERTQDARATVFNHLEKLIAPKRLRALDEAVLGDFQQRLRKTGIRETSIGGHLAHLKAALGWAARQKLIRKVPHIQMPGCGDSDKRMRGRPVTGEEYDRLLDAVPKVRPRDTAAWRFFIQGLYLSGLRLGEALRLSWDIHELFTVAIDGKSPVFYIHGSAQKSGRTESVPMAPDFAELLQSVPLEQREGHVFKLPAEFSGRQMTDKRACRIVSAIGKAANIVVAPGQFATAHDLRRSFGTRWARLVRPVVLKKLMRHRHVETTENYYVDLDAEEVSADLQREFGRINTFVNSRDFRPSEAMGRADDD